MSNIEKPWHIDMTKVSQDDRELVNGLHSRDTLACTCIMEWYAPAMTRLALRMVGDRDEAAGAVQDSFIAACSKMDGFRADSA